MVDLFSTNTGSHLWSMQRPESDIDYYVAYQAPSIDFLLGHAHTGSHQSIIGLDDRQSHEIGRVVDELLKGNFNHIIGVMSPLTMQDWSELPKLRELTKLNLSKCCYNSIHGLAIHNMKKYIWSPTKELKPLTPEAKQKKLNTVMRTLKFGITLIETAEFKFEPAWDATEEDIKNAIAELDESYANCDKLPDKPQAVNEMMDWLLDIRFQQLSKDLVPNKSSSELLYGILSGAHTAGKQKK